MSPVAEQILEHTGSLVFSNRPWGNLTRGTSVPLISGVISGCPGFQHSLFIFLLNISQLPSHGLLVIICDLIEALVQFTLSLSRRRLL